MGRPQSLKTILCPPSCVCSTFSCSSSVAVLLCWYVDYCNCVICSSFFLPLVLREGYWPSCGFSLYSSVIDCVGVKRPEKVKKEIVEEMKEIDREESVTIMKVKKQEK